MGKGESTSDAKFILRQVQEKHIEKKKELFHAFVDLQKAFDRVPREIIRWALRRQKGPGETDKYSNGSICECKL